MQDDEKKDHISEALNLTPLIQEPINREVDNLIANAHDDSARRDFELARANIHEVIQNGQHAMDKLSQIADSSQHPRAFEVLAKLMDTMLTANKDLLELQRQIRDISEADNPTNENAKNVTNNLFVGSTAELQKVIDQMKNNGTE